MSGKWGRVRGWAVTRSGRECFSLQWTERPSLRGVMRAQVRWRNESKGENKHRVGEVGAGGLPGGFIWSLFPKDQDMASLGLSSKTQVYFWWFMLQWSILALNLGNGRDWVSDPHNSLSHPSAKALFWDVWYPSFYSCVCHAPSWRSALDCRIPLTFRLMPPAGDGALRGRICSLPISHLPRNCLVPWPLVNIQ